MTARKPRAEEHRIALTKEAGVTFRPVKDVVRRAERMLDVLGFSNVEVSLALVGDETITELNGRYRKKRKATDVLSFPLHEIALGDFYEAARATRLHLGDIIVSVPTADRQAKEHDRAVIDEVTTLVAHGLLHLLGFDHRTDDEEREMDAYVRVLEAAATNKKPLAMALTRA